MSADISVCLSPDYFDASDIDNRFPEAHHLIICSAICKLCRLPATSILAAAVLGNTANGVVVRLSFRREQDRFLERLAEKDILPCVYGVVGPVPAGVRQATLQAFVSSVCPEAVIELRRSGSSAHFLVPVAATWPAS